MTPQPTTPPVTPTSSSDIGVSLSSGNWLATVNSVKSSQGSQYVPPKAGNIYLLINATMKDTDVSNHTISIIAFSLRDDQGNSYPYAYVPDVQELSGDVVAGQQLRGYLIFQVPKSLHTFTLQFNPPQVPYMPPGQQPARQNVKIAALICWVAATFIAIVGGTSTLVIAGLLNIAVFVLIFFI